MPQTAGLSGAAIRDQRVRERYAWVRSRVMRLLPGSPPTNPAGTDGFGFVDYAHPEPGTLHALFRTMGFEPVAKHRAKAVTLYRQGDVNYLVNEEPGSHAVRFAAEHGPCASSMAFRVVDGQHAYERAISLGAEPVDPATGSLALDVPAVKGIGGSLLYFLDRYGEKGAAFDPEYAWLGERDPKPDGVGLYYLDHLTHNVGHGRMDLWVGFYERIFNFREIRFFDIKGEYTSLLSRALTSPDGKIRIPINESADEQSQIEELAARCAGPVAGPRQRSDAGHASRGRARGGPARGPARGRPARLPRPLPARVPAVDLSRSAGAQRGRGAPALLESCRLNRSAAVPQRTCASSRRSRPRTGAGPRWRRQGSRTALAGDPTINDPSGNALPSVASALAPTRHPAPIRAPLSTVAHGDVRADGEGETRIGVQHRPLLDVAALADLDPLVVGSQHDAEPDAHVRRHPEPARFGQLGRLVVQGVDRHQVVPSG